MLTPYSDILMHLDVQIGFCSGFKNIIVYFIVGEDCWWEQPFAFMTHMIVTYSQNNKAFNHVIAASSSSWLQEHVADMSERYVTSVLVAHLNVTLIKVQL